MSPLMKIKSCMRNLATSHQWRFFAYFNFFNHSYYSEGGVDPAAHGAKQEDRFYNNKSFQKPDVDPSDPSQQDAALKIQTKYRQHHAKKVNSR